MSDLLILGTDTDAGKTTFALLWLAAFADAFDYWKPLESGASDSECVAGLVPVARVHPPVRSFRRAVAPLQAARDEGWTIPAAAALAAARPQPSDPSRRLLIETFGSPLSPLNEAELQLELWQALAIPALLVTSTAVGTIGRTLQCLAALEAAGLEPSCIVLAGVRDAFAEEQIARHGRVSRVFALQPPTSWDVEGVERASRQQRGVLMQIRQAIASPPAPKPTIKQILDTDRQSIWHPYTSLGDREEPLVAMAAQDEFLTLADGRRVIDGISSWWTILHGHRHSPLLAALSRAGRSIDHVHFAGVTHPWAVELAERLLATMPWPGGRVFYSDNGSTAVEVALKMSYQFWCHHGEPERTWFVGFENGYHGDTFGAMAVGRDPVFFGAFEPLLFRAEIVPLDVDRLDAALSRRHGEVAAVIVEPLVQGAGGMRMHSPDTLGQLAEAARRHNVLFIADEVMTGGGRTGGLWAHQAAGLRPDLVCTAKTLAGGVLPLAATLVAPHIARAWETGDPRRTFFHGHSFTAHPLACAVAIANWKLLTDDPPSAPSRMERFWRESLADLRGHPRVRDVRVLGTIAAVEVQAEGGYLSDVRQQLRQTCLAHGVILRPLGNVLYAMPPFCSSETSLARIAEAITAAVSQPDLR